ncbi:MAG: hypothetical protein Q9217_003869 [Psora testacea]
MTVLLRSSCEHIMAQTREIIQRRILNFETLLCLNQTPLLQEQVRHAISLHCEALDAPDASPFIEDLNTLYVQIGEHWKKVNGNMVVAVSLRQSIFALEVFLVSKLLEDYANQPYHLEPGMRGIADCVAEERNRSRQISEGRDSISSARGYYDGFIFPLEEMVLNREHVEKKLHAAAERKGNPGSDIEPLIKRGDWPDLAGAILYDRELANRLFDTKAYTSEQHETVIQGIDRIQKEYFVELKSPTVFTTNSRARELTMQSRSEPLTENRHTWIQMLLTGRKQNKPSPESDMSPLIWDTETSGVSLKKIE